MGFVVFETQWSNHVLTFFISAVGAFIWLDCGLLKKQYLPSVFQQTDTLV